MPRAALRHRRADVTARYEGPLRKLHCTSEDGELKELVYGRTDDFRLPAYDPMLDFGGARILELLKRAGGQLFREADPEWYEIVHEEMEAVVEFLRDRDVVVHRPCDHTAAGPADFALQSRWNSNDCIRDSLVTVGDTLVETAFRTPERMRSKHAVRYVSMELLRQGNRVLSMPQPLHAYEHDEDPSPVVEGGDVEIDGEHIYIGNSGQASNSLGVTWFRNAFPEFDVHEIEISPARLPHQHLDSVMVAFSTWGCALFDDIVGGFEGLPEPLKQKNWIELTLDEAKGKLGSFIALNPEEVIMAREAERLAAEVERLGIKVHRLPYGGVGRIGGSFRSNSCPLFRE